MLTRCPHCATLYRVRPEQLDAAQGLVRCSRCDQTFDGVAQLMDDAESPTADGTGEPDATPEPDHPPRNPPRLLIPGDDLDQEPRRGGWLWAIGALLLLALLALQLGWQQRERLIEHPLGRELLERGCDWLGCELPVRRDLAAIRVAGRDAWEHPDRRNALYLRLTLVNDAGFAQPFPRLRLRLFGALQELLGERVFEPRDYLPEGHAGATLMPPQREVQAILELAAPKARVDGFEFELL